jgi:serine/threonine-protein kinase
VYARSTVVELTSVQRALQDQLVREAPAREAQVARFMGTVSALSAMASVALGPLIGWPLAGTLAGLLSVIALYDLLLVRALRRGWYRAWVRWVNVTLEVSAPGLIFLVDVRWQGPVYALTAPPLVILGTIVALSGLRGSRTLALGAGAIAAGEYALLYTLVAWPLLEPGAPVTLRPALIATRVVLRFFSGVLTATFVGALNRRAADALSAVRSKDVFGKYLLHERIGAGGMAEVFHATYSPEGGFEKAVALKRVLPAFADDAEFITLFRLEAQLCSRLAHPNIVQVLDFGKFADTYFLAMEFVDGLSLKRLLDRHPAGLPVAAVLHVAHELLSALEYMHARTDDEGAPLELVHRDLNPPNILLSMQGEVKLADFGIARAATRVAVTQLGRVRGKGGYLSPEQAAAEPLDARTDLFALGATLWECATGRRLFPVGEDERSVREVFRDQSPRASTVRSGLPPVLDEVIAWLVEPSLNVRCPSARKALARLATIAPEVRAGGREALRVAMLTGPAPQSTADATTELAAAQVQTRPS